MFSVNTEPCTCNVIEICLNSIYSLELSKKKLRRKCSKNRPSQSASEQISLPSDRMIILKSVHVRSKNRTLSSMGLPLLSNSLPPHFPPYFSPHTIIPLKTSLSLSLALLSPYLTPSPHISISVPNPPRPSDLCSYDGVQFDC